MSRARPISMISSLKHLIPLILLTVSLPGQAILCTASSDHYPGFDDGVLFSKEVNLTGIQGTPPGHVLLAARGQFSFWLVAGLTLQSGNEPARLMNFYVEIQSSEKDRAGVQAIRAMSGAQEGIPKARIEMVRYDSAGLQYQGMLIFSGTRYE